MKKMFNGRNFIGKKSIILIAVSLILVAVTAVSATASWIEEVSQVEFSTNSDSQQTPLHVGEKILKADANMANENQVVNLNEYFYKAGDMHLSPCYSDGEKFYFPVAGKNNEFREGTKDDANVSYMSATFRINSIDANTAYWFEKTGSEYVTFKKGGTSNSNATLRKYLRCSVTIDGATNVYSFDDTSTSGTYEKNYKTVENNSVTDKTGRSLEEYSYYTESFSDTNPEEYYKNDANKTNKPNQGGGDNLNGNTLFTVNKFDNDTNSGTKVVTVKLWLEYNGAVQSIINPNVDIASVNINFVSSWAKTRRVYVKDATVRELNRTQAKWLAHNGSLDNKAGLFWAIKGQESDLNWKLTRLSNTSDYYFVDIPAVYNNVPAVLSRRSGTSSWADTTQWDKWETTFPDTFHSEVYTVYSTVFATWNNEDVHNVSFINSCSFANPKVYMWDTNSIHGDGINDKVVKNADWPGVNLTQLYPATSNKYTLFYNSDYSNAIFSNGLAEGANWEHQSQDINNLSNFDGKTFDMATLTWFNSNALPTYKANSYVTAGLFTGSNDHYTSAKLAYGGTVADSTEHHMDDTTTNNFVCRFYSKYGASDSYHLDLALNVNGTWYKAWNDDPKVGSADTYKLIKADDTHSEDLQVYQLNAKALYSVYFTKVTGEDAYNVNFHLDKQY